MDLVRSWMAALLVGLVAYVALGFVIAGPVTYETLTSPLGGFVFLRVPAFVIPGLMAFVAGVVHPRPRRDRASRHAAAVFAVPVAALVINAVGGIGQRDATTMLVAMLVGLAGIAAGWFLGHLVRNGGRR